MAHAQTQGFQARRSTTLALCKIFLLAIAQLPYVHGAPLFTTSSLFRIKEEGKPADDPSLWMYLSVAAALVLLGGAFAGLTIALMGQDEIYLQVIKTSGEGKEKRHAAKVLKLLNKGKHWVLVTLLLSNVITNETLPIVLDRSLGGGWPAVLGSTVLIVIFGEIAPQSVCVRYGLPIGAWMSPFVLGLMYIMAPVAWPTAKLLDYLLGEDHGTIYKKAGLKTLVSLHKTMGEAGHQLNADEVTIITAVLDLKEKPVGGIMTEMKDVFVLSVDDILDEETMDEILAMGYSRIPVHASDNPYDFVGMLLVKMLITYDPEDARPVRDFALATLPETGPETSCLDIINFFQEGKSHMVLVSDNPGGDSGALGVVTLEDVIEELIGEEIIDESDVFIDVHKAIRRIAPAPRARYRDPKSLKGKVVTESTDDLTQSHNGALVDISEISNELSYTQTADTSTAKTKNATTEVGSPRAPTFMLRRRSSTQNSDKGMSLRLNINAPEVKEHLSHLGPSNLASRPRTTRYQNVKIKPGQNIETPGRSASIGIVAPSRHVSDVGPSEYQGGIGEAILSSAGKEASDGVQALHSGYGTINQHGSPDQSKGEENQAIVPSELPTITEPTHDLAEERISRKDSRPRSSTRGSEQSQSTLKSLRERRNGDKSPVYSSKGPARSGSITENIVDINGVRKVVLELTSSDESKGGDDGARSPGRPKNSRSSTVESSHASIGTQLRGGADEGTPSQPQKSKAKKKKKKKKNAGKGEQQPLLG